MKCVCGEAADNDLGVHEKCLGELGFDAMAATVVDGLQRLALENGSTLRASVIRRITAVHNAAGGHYETSASARKTFVAAVRELDGLVDDEWARLIELAVKKFSPSFSLHPAEDVGRFAWRDVAKAGVQGMLKRKR